MGRKKQSRPVEQVYQEPPYIPRTPVTEEAKRVAFAEAQEYWQVLCERYGALDTLWEDVPLHVQKRLQAILGAPDQEKLQEIRKRAFGAIEMRMLALWAARHIPGPTDKPETWMKLYRRRVSLAAMLEKNGDLDGAARQWRAAEEYEARAQALVRQSGGGT